MLGTIRAGSFPEGRLCLATVDILPAFRLGMLSRFCYLELGMNTGIWRRRWLRSALLATLAYFTGLGVSFAEDIEARLAGVRANYESQVEKALGPTKVSYLNQLNELKKTLGGRGDIDGGLLVEKEINALAVGKSAAPEGERTGVEPPELERLRSSYQTAADRLLLPLTEKYFNFLEALKKDMGSRGDLASAQIVQKEIERLNFEPRSSLSGGGNDEIVIWNTYHSDAADRGTDKMNVVLLKDGKEVWKRTGMRLPWEIGKDTKSSVVVPRMDFDTIRIEITEYHHAGGGLAEVQVFRDGKNIALGEKVEVSGFHGGSFKGELVVDGVTTSKNRRQGYWLLPDRTEGWLMIRLED